MKPLAFNLAGAKKIAGDKNSSTFHLKNGHKIMVAHAALPAEQRKQLEKMPIHLAAGGEANQSTQPDPSQDPTADLPQDTTSTPELPGGGNAYAQAAGIDPNAAPTPYDVPTDKMGAAYATAANAQNSDQSLPAADPNLPGAGTPVGSDSAPAPAQGQPASALPPQSGVDITGAYNQGQKSITESQDVATQLAKSQAAAQQQDLADREDLQKTMQQNTQDFQNQQKQFMSDYMNNHIDPTHYMENMSSGQKVATGIGLFLGGFSSAFTHQGNPAMDFLNKQIDRDIQGQQNRMDQQKTILGANQELYHDQMLANNATRINMNDIYDHKIALAASQLGTASAQANADAAHSKFALENAGLMQQNVIRASVLQAIQRGATGGLDPATLGQAGIIPQADATKEQSAYLAKKAAIASGNQAYDDAGNQTVLQKINPLNWHTGAALGVDQSTLANNLVAVAPTKRYSVEMANELIAPFLPNRTDNAAQLAIKKQGYMNLIDRESSGEMPLSSRYMTQPQSPPSQGAPKAPVVGQTLFVKGQKVQIINAKGDYKPVS